MGKLVKVAICGVSGYVGSQLVQLISKHQGLSLVAVVTNKTVAEIYVQQPLLTKAGVAVYDYNNIDSLAYKVYFLLL